MAEETTAKDDTRGLDNNVPASTGDTENPQNGRGQAVFVRHCSESRAMAGHQRFLNKMRHAFCWCFQKPVEQELKENEEQDGKPLQFRLAATRRTASKAFHVRVWEYITCKSKPAGSSDGIHTNQKLSMFLHWMFRVNFLFLFMVMCAMYFAFVIIFSALIIAAGSIDEECVRIGGNVFGFNNTEFADAFALSWTTFSTVGYGSTYPALGNENDNPSNCLFITLICSLESFVGVLYSGFCGAILFGKVLRIQSHAQVTFSDPIVVRYGSGVVEQTDSEDLRPSEDGKKPPKLPCPVLEFRVVNRLFNEIGGEIMDASLNVVANVDANDADPSLRDALDPRRQAFLRQRDENALGSTTAESGSERTSDSGTIDSMNSSLNFRIPKLLDPLTSAIQGKRDHHTVDEDPSSRLVSKRIFSKMLIEASDHPFFKRVWLARHILDDSSPILKPKVRRQIRKNGGYWPESLNSYQGLRDSLQFNQILVSLNGVSNVSASDVYAQKIYDFVDINIGYQFVNTLYRDADGSLKVDTDLINDVKEQNGGGGEPLILDA